MEKQYQHDEQELESGQDRIAQLKKRIQELAEEKLKAKTDFDDAQGKYLTEREEPVRIEKTNANLRQATEHLEKEVAGLQQERDDHDEKTKHQTELVARNKTIIEEHKAKGLDHERQYKALAE